MPASWRELIERVYLARPNASRTATRPRFHPPASREDIAAVEERLRVSLPGSLKSFLSETNGVMDLMSVDGGDFFENMWLVWGCERIAEENLGLRNRSGPSFYEREPVALVFFAGAGVDGIMFALPATNENTCDANVVAWYPIGGRVRGLADSLESFIDGWLTNRITV
jgi:hypothetical protein